MARTLVGRQVAVALDKAEVAVDAAVAEIATFKTCPAEVSFLEARSSQSRFPEVATLKGCP